MIHEVDERLFELPLSQYVLTFDDGLYTQYKYIDRICNINTDKFFYISSGIVCENIDKQSQEFIRCSEAHEKVLKFKNKENYMTWEQIKEIDNRPRCHIGAHSHSHQTFKHGTPTVKYIIDDTRLMLETFNKMLGRIPKHYCFPYNYYTSVYKSFIEAKGFDTKLSIDRIDVMDLLLNKTLNDMSVTLSKHKWTCI
jgi:peptidoglycan/xylan/chitin deacetylase (PgdA/CDA1 family)